MSKPAGNLERSENVAVVMLSGGRFVCGCALSAGALFIAGRFFAFSPALLAGEVFATIVGLFVFGSFRYQIHKNALAYGMLLVIIATFSGLESTQWHVEIAERGWWHWRANIC